MGDMLPHGEPEAQSTRDPQKPEEEDTLTQVSSTLGFSFFFHSSGPYSVRNGPSLSGNMF